MNYYTCPLWELDLSSLTATQKNPHDPSPKFPPLVVRVHYLGCVLLKNQEAEEFLRSGNISGPVSCKQANLGLSWTVPPSKH